jgi:two-component system, NtrC family, response regulator HydG
MTLSRTSLQSLIARAGQEVRDYQAMIVREPTKASISIAGEPYMLFPTSSLALALPQLINELSGLDLGNHVVYQLGYAIGYTQAEHFFHVRNIPLAELDLRLFTGPLYSAWAGLGNVELLDLALQKDSTFHILWESSNSSSAEAAIAANLHGRYCYLQAGHAAGWCSAASGLELACQEIACAAEGIKKCRFLVAPLLHLAAKVSNPAFHRPRSDYHIMDMTSYSDLWH